MGGGGGGKAPQQRGTAKGVSSKRNVLLTACKAASRSGGPLPPSPVTLSAKARRLAGAEHCFRGEEEERSKGS